MKAIAYLVTSLAAWTACCPWARADTLEYWKFDIRQSRLEIVTDEDVKPKVQLLSQPTRLVIDLPNIQLSGPTIAQAVSSFVREVRLGQVDSQTARIVIELDRQYSLRPWEVKVRGLAPNRWFIQLPKFQPLSAYGPPAKAVAIAVPPPTPYPKSSYLVVIDPGHGGQDPGAIGIGGLQEKQVVLPIALAVEKRLRSQGIRVVMTRSSDRFLSLKDRVALAEKVNAHVFVSIHANAVGGQQSAVNGLETYYYETGNSLAQSIHRSILRRFKIVDRGTKRARFYVLRQTSMPSSLVEVGFVTGNTDGPNLAQASYRQRMAEAIAEGIVDYLR